MGPMTCEQLHQVVPEVALGVLSGSERADALGHLQDCPACQVIVDEMARVSDALLFLAPEEDPPLGFENRVAAALGLEGQPRARHSARRISRIRVTRRTWTIGGSALAGVAACAAGLAVWLGGGSPAPSQSTSAPAQVAAPRGSVPSFKQATFRTSSGTAAGRVMAHSGRPSWVFMTVDEPGAEGWVVCDLETTTGTVRLGRFDVYEGHGSWGAATPVAIGSLRGARLVADDGTVIASATF